jgi:threonine dehydratase
MAGQGTLGLDVMRSVPSADVVVVPISGGGLISGVATAIKGVSPSTIVVKSLSRRFCLSAEVIHDGMQVGAEPVGANDCTLSKAAGRLTRLDATDTICDGLRLVTCEVWGVRCGV